MHLRFLNFLYFMTDESVQPWINKDYFKLLVSFGERLQNEESSSNTF